MTYLSQLPNDLIDELFNYIDIKTCEKLTDPGTGIFSKLNDEYWKRKFKEKFGGFRSYRDMYFLMNTYDPFSTDIFLLTILYNCPNIATNLPFNEADGGTINLLIKFGTIEITDAYLKLDTLDKNTIDNIMWSMISYDRADLLATYFKTYLLKFNDIK